MIVIVAVLALVAVAALALLAWKYGGMTPAGEVDQVRAGGRSVTNGLPPASGERMETFLAARAAVIDTLQENPAAFDSLCDEVAQDTRDRRQVKMHHDVLMRVRLRRASVLSSRGMEEADYQKIRDEYRGWLMGNPSVDPGWKDLFDANENRLDAVGLGRCESLDY